MNKTKLPPAQFREGDWVSFQYGTWPMVAQIIEVRGPLGVNRRQLYRVRVFDESGEADSFELPEEELRSANIPEKSKVIDFLKNGGLVEMLRRNSPEPVWLTYKPNPNGEITFTFHEQRGLLGGKPVPFYALDVKSKDKIFEPKKKEVLTFLRENFGLTESEALQVVTAVGTA